MVYSSYSKVILVHLAIILIILRITQEHSNKYYSIPSRSQNSYFILIVIIVVVIVIVIVVIIIVVIIIIGQVFIINNS